MDSLRFIFDCHETCAMYLSAKIIVELLKISTAFGYEPLKNYHQTQIAKYRKGLKFCYVKH